jgi:hypothetical protein
MTLESTEQAQCGVSDSNGSVAPLNGLLALKARQGRPVDSSIATPHAHLIPSWSGYSDTATNEPTRDTTILREFVE